MFVSDGMLANPGAGSLRITTDLDPDFSKAIGNITVPIGREAVLSCSVTNLGPYKVNVYYLVIKRKFINKCLNLVRYGICYFIYV